jgi:hypothetical protein
MEKSCKIEGFVSSRYIQISRDIAAINIVCHHIGFSLSWNGLCCPRDMLNLFVYIQTQHCDKIDRPGAGRDPELAIPGGEVTAGLKAMYGS